ncbi:outer membrane protein [uncultured Nitratireductor sp.]|uniref:outer membrane protein n=1 Tax=uncultured Nitratireductor sp. TaxID=520953 RepID=UPI0025EE7CB1|nr:outer membrane protein [uncultured Nitratireductor sp.]
MAADLVRQEPIAETPMAIDTPIKDWVGGYAGVTAAAGRSGLNEEKWNFFKPDGFAASGFAGYNFQNGVLVYGAEGDLGYNGLKGNDRGVALKGGVEGSLRARLGYAVTDNLLLYTTAGLAAGRVELSEGGKSDTNTMLGWTAGAGADAMLTDRVFARAEYRFTQYGDFAAKTFDLGSGSATPTWGSHRVGIGFGVKF